LKKVKAHLRYLDPDFYVRLIANRTHKNSKKIKWKIFDFGIALVVYLIYAYLIYFSLGFILQTSTPIVIVTSGSMEPVIQRGDIIIIQGDTGSLYTGGFSESSIITIRERLSNLNAIYIPDEKYDLFYDGMTPVNTFRIIENTVFNEDYLLLKDKTYWSTKDTPHNYKDVSNHLLN